MLRKTTLRGATLEDADAIANVYLASRKKFIDFAPLIHSDEDIYQWIRNTLIPSFPELQDYLQISPLAVLERTWRLR